MAGLGEGQKRRDRAQVCWALVSALWLFGCDDQTVPKETAKAAGSALSDEPSPNASILPEPLGEKKGKVSSSEAGADDVEKSKPVAIPRPQPIPLSLREALSEDALPRGGFGGGYEARARFVWPSAQSSVLISGKKIPTWPQFELEFLREFPDQPARMRLILASPTFSLISGTELRFRTDRIGALLVWPDLRSYRVIAPGTLTALFSDKRADRLPFLEPTLKVLEPTNQAGRIVAHSRVETVLGTAEMDIAQLPDLPYAAPLLCKALLDMIRVEDNEDLCPQGGLVIRMSVSWKAGGGFLFEVLGYKQNARLELDQMRMPPSLPIFKKGELPPSDEYVLGPKLRQEVFPIKFDEKSFAPRPEPKTEESTAPTTEAPVPAVLVAEPMMAPDEVELSNTTTRPLIVQLDRFPYVWLSPGETTSLRVRGAPVFYAARDFWGHVQLEPGLSSAPTRIVFGASSPATGP